MGLVILALSVLAIGVVLGLVGESAGLAGESGAAPTPTVAAQPQGSPSQTSQPQAAQTPRSGLPTVAESDLPDEGHDTLDLIRAGGPFPHRQDDETFFNREGILPQQRQGYYREYTVPTRGSPDRGARRIVGGRDGDLYYTQDHYDSFRQIEEGR